MKKIRSRVAEDVRSPAGLAVALSLAVAPLGCGGAGSSPMAVRVGGDSIERRSVDHWASVIARGAIVANVADPSWPPRQQALALLVYSHWLIGEAARLGLRPSPGQLRALIERQQRSLPNGRAEFQELLAASGETLADAEFEARARWAAATLARQFATIAERQARAQVSTSTIARFYREHAASYHLRERRFYDLLERIPSKARARTLVRQFGTGARFAENASKERPFRPKTFAGLPGQAVVYRAVFAAKAGELVGPLPLQGAYAMFIVRRIQPAHVRPLAEVRGAIERQLLSAAERRARAQLIADFHRRWAARTDCGGYLIQKCRQYRGRDTAERDPLADF